MRASFAVLSSLAAVVYAVPHQPRTVTEWTFATTAYSTEYILEVCQSTVTTTSTGAGVTITTPNAGTTYITESWFNFGGTSTYKVPVKREETVTKTWPTLSEIDVVFTTDCVNGPFDIRTRVLTTPNPTSTTAVPSYEHTATTTTWWPTAPTSTT
ncbi:hypothetical protein DL96DRAFT_1810665 [Flagelloscypha sp. PMI_526]|nr:hypothetical protein DL96DRAFT_1810665 [Flagelloscypha sp. PMI_526]